MTGPKPTAAPVDTVRLKRDIAEGNKAVPVELMFSMDPGDVGKTARAALKENVARGDSLVNARAGRIPAEPTSKAHHGAPNQDVTGRAHHGQKP